MRSSPNFVKLVWNHATKATIHHDKMAGPDGSDHSRTGKQDDKTRLESFYAAAVAACF